MKHQKIIKKPECCQKSLTFFFFFSHFQRSLFSSFPPLRRFLEVGDVHGLEAVRGVHLVNLDAVLIQFPALAGNDEQNFLKFVLCGISIADSGGELPS